MYGDVVKLNCIAEGLPVPTITWLMEPYSGGMPVDIVTRNSVTESVNATHIMSFLTLLSVNPSDAANYTCSASNFLGSETEKAFIEVLGTLHIHYLASSIIHLQVYFFMLTGRAEISFPEIPVNVRVNDTNPVNVTCSARGSPAPSFTWYIGGVAALLSQVFSSSNGDVPDFISTVSTLSITSATPEDSNIYTCVAFNTIYGVQVNDSQRYTLTINCK